MKTEEDYLGIAEAIRKARTGEEALNLLKSKPLVQYFNERWKNLFERFVECDPTDTAQLAEWCRKGKELQNLISGLETQVLVGMSSRDSLASVMKEEREE